MNKSKFIGISTGIVLLLTFWTLCAIKINIFPSILQILYNICTNLVDNLVITSILYPLALATCCAWIPTEPVAPRIAIVLLIKNLACKSRPDSRRHFLADNKRREGHANYQKNGWYGKDGVKSVHYSTVTGE